MCAKVALFIKFYNDILAICNLKCLECDKVYCELLLQC